MTKNHIKRLAAPNTWPIKRKAEIFITRPYPGAHRMDMGISLATAMRDIIKCAKTKKEIKSILQTKEFLVDGRPRDEKNIIGIMDVIEIKKTNEFFRILLDKDGKITAIKIKKDEGGFKPCKILSKTALGKDRIQLNLSGSRNLNIKKNEYKTGDTLLITLPDQTVKDHLKFEDGVQVYLTGGKHVGEVGSLVSIDEKTIKVKSKEGVFETAKRYAFVIGKDKPVIALE